MERRMLQDRGWRVRHSLSVSSTPWDYQHYIQNSLGEFSCVKPSCIGGLNLIPPYDRFGLKRLAIGPNTDLHRSYHDLPGGPLNIFEACFPQQLLRKLVSETRMAKAAPT